MDMNIQAHIYHVDTNKHTYQPFRTSIHFNYSTFIKILFFLAMNEALKLIPYLNEYLTFHFHRDPSFLLNIKTIIIPYKKLSLFQFFETQLTVIARAKKYICQSFDEIIIVHIQRKLLYKISFFSCLFFFLHRSNDNENS